VCGGIFDKDLSQSPYGGISDHRGTTKVTDPIFEYALQTCDPCPSYV